ncbi:D-2-hydroxyacid dehydrogenase [Thaumasiovibrio sp. DFM-14]|uniref:D-2-hydroxyacid dehydrogenase n=1 Tax=Thaumasiovibrio sp. DFM-14 TaxID=3384792 RepID=UPI0039A222B1
MHHIVYLDTDTIPAHISIPHPNFPHTWQSYGKTQPHEVVERLKNATIVITNKVVLDAAILAQLPQLQLIAVSATGTNNIDIDDCRQRGIPVCNIRGYATRSVPEHVIGMMFTLRRNLMGYHHDIEQGEWLKQNTFCFFTHPIGDIEGATIGIVGSGSLGNAVAQRAAALGMNVLFAEHKGRTTCRQGYTPFNNVLARADVISLHCPLNAQTEHLIGHAEISCMKNTAILINTGRGGLLDEQAVVDALKSGELGGAGIDVFVNEPADNKNPLIAHASLPNLLLTPHVAWGSDSAIQTLVNQLIDNLNQFVAGHPQHLL